MDGHGLIMSGESFTRILYDGSGLSGKTTSMTQVLNHCGNPIDALSARGSAHQCALAISSVQYRLELMSSIFRAWLVFETPQEAAHEPRIAEEMNFLRTCDGIVFVVDSREFRLDASVAAFELLQRDLVFLGRNSDEIPIVFQINMRDAVGAVGMEVLSGLFPISKSIAVESVAPRGYGTMDAIRCLLQLIKKGKH